MAWSTRPFPYLIYDLAQNLCEWDFISSVSFPAKFYIDINDYFEKHVFQWANAIQGRPSAMRT